jgi:hypothetical protein
MPRQALVPSLALMAFFGACRGRDGAPEAQVAAASPTLRTDVSVSEITLGRAIETSRRVVQPQDTFAPADTVYASVVLEGSARHAGLKARWTSADGQVVSEASLEVAPTVTTVSEFHISRPDGLPSGPYQVEIFLDGASAGKRTFTVQ